MIKESTEQETIKLIISKGGSVQQINHSKGRTYFDIICKNGHFFSKEKNKLLYRNQYCTYYPCNFGRKTEWRDPTGFQLYKKRIKEIFGDDVICIENNPKKSSKFAFKCNICGNIWHNSPSYQVTTPKRKSKPPSCLNCGGSKPMLLSEKEQALNELHIEAVDGLIMVKNLQTKFLYKCVKCNYLGFKTLNNLLNLKKENLGYCSCTYKRIHWDLEKLINYGKENGFQLLETPEKLNYSKAYLWQCEKGHKTLFGIGSIESGCIECYNEKRFTSLVDIHNWLTKNESSINLVLGQLWKGSSFQYSFFCTICEVNFNRSIHSILNGSLCPNQTRSFSEIVVQHYLEKILNINFITNKKYNFLINSNGNKMELDGYNEKFKIAFEHHGLQHYELGFFHEDDNVLRKRIQDDSLKRELCRKNNIKLIEIPALFVLTPLEDLKQVIKNELLKNSIAIPENFDEINPTLSDLNYYHKKRKL
jgi:hypothetical protein